MVVAAFVVAAAVGSAWPSGSGSTVIAEDRRIPEARAVRACAGAGAYWPTMTLAVSGSVAWVACKERGRVIRMNLTRARRTGVVRTSGSVLAVTTGLGSVWALDTNSILYRINPRTARVMRRIPVGASAPYNIWIGGGSVWVADDRAARVIRVSPRRNRVVARIAVGDGPSDIAFAGDSAWVIAHRDLTLFRIRLASNAATRLARVGSDAAERMVMHGDSLWVTGRGNPLLQVDPDTGAVRRTIAIGGTGIDVAVAGGDLWVPVRTEAVDRTGFPTMTALRRVTTAGTVTTAATASGRVDVHGMAAGTGAVWLADNTDGFLYRIPT